MVFLSEDDQRRTQVTPLLKTHFAPKRGLTETVVHHKKSRKGNLMSFYDPSNLEAVCWSCHSGAIQSEEALGYETTIGSDGWPVDENYPTIRVEKNMMGIF